MIKNRLILAVLSILAAPLLYAETYLQTIYVSPQGNDSGTGSLTEPVASLGKAMSMAAEVIKAADEKLPAPEKRQKGVQIILRDGRYYLSEPLRIDEESAWPVTIQAYKNEKPVLSGGVKLPNNWAVETVNGHKVWTQTLPEAAAGTWYFRQLWINGKAAAVPVLPKQGSCQIAELITPDEQKNKTPLWQHASKDRFVFHPGDFRSDWHNPDDIWVMASCYWFHNYLTLKNIDETNRLVTFKQATEYPLIVAHPLHGKSITDTSVRDIKTFYEPAYYRIHNVFEALESPGEFYLDRPAGKLYYIPREGEDINTVDAVAPRLNQLLIVKSGNKTSIRGIRFEGITFSHTAVQPEKHRGTGNNTQSSPDAVIHLSGLTDSAFTGCEFSRIGEYAMMLTDGTRDIDITGNHFFDLGAGAIKTHGDFSDSIKSAEITPRTTMRLRITDNRIHEGGRFFPAYAVLNLNKVRNCVIAFNEIYDCYFTGIHLGARWGRDLDFSIVDSRILHNHIHHLGQGLWSANDMAGIYVNGVGLGVEVAGNIVHDMICSVYGATGIYLDQEPCYVEVRNNLIYNTNYDGIHLKGFENRIVNNIVYNCTKGLGQVVPNSDRPLAFVEHNIFIPSSSVIYHSKFVGADQLGFLAKSNLVWSIESENKLKVSGTKGSLGYEEWRTRTGQDAGAVIAPVEFKDPANGNFAISGGSSVEACSAAGFVPFDISAGPRPPDQRTVLPFRKDNEAVNSPGFRKHVDLIAADHAAKNKTPAAPVAAPGTRIQ